MERHCRWLDGTGPKILQDVPLFRMAIRVVVCTGLKLRESH